MDAVREPLLLIPFAAFAAAQARKAMAVSWNGAEAQLGADGETARLTGAVTVDEAHGVLTRAMDLPVRTSERRMTRAALDPSVQATLDEFAQRTYAPASDASRMTGAGAGLTDND